MRAEPENGQAAMEPGPTPAARLPAERASLPFSEVRRTLSRRQRRVLQPPLQRPAAVLVPLFESGGETHVLFTLRTDTVPQHKGQVAFPGGAWQADDRDLLATALRESHEEIGLEARHVEILGALDDVVTISSYQITPWVGRIDWPLNLTVSEAETAEIFTIPLRRLLDPALCRIEERVVGERRYYPVHWFEGGPHPVWGITGHILAHFLDVVHDWRHPDLDPSRIRTDI